MEWPDHHAPSHGSAVELGFDSEDAAREWHGLIVGRVRALQAAGISSGGGADPFAGGELVPDDSLNSLGGGSGGGGGGGGEVDDASPPTSPAPTTPVRACFVWLLLRTA